MAVVAASNNGGRYNKVHRQTDDGLVISVISGNSLLPLVFRYEDYLGDCVESLLSNGQYYHKRLMRGDCGWRREDDSALTTFSWNALETRLDGFSEAPTGEYVESYHQELNCAKDVAICGHKGHRTVFYRKDREYWTPDHVLMGDKTIDPFGPEIQQESNSCCSTDDNKYDIPTISQFNPNTCEPRAADKCGILKYKEDR